MALFELFLENPQGKKKKERKKKILLVDKVITQGKEKTARKRNRKTIFNFRFLTGFPRVRTKSLLVKREPELSLTQKESSPT